MKSGHVSFLLVCLTTAYCCNAAFVNAGFEDAPFPTYGPWDASGGNRPVAVGTSGTQVASSSVVNNFVNVRGGSRAIYASVTRDEFAQLSQSIPVTPGNTYEVGFYQCIGTNTDPGPIGYDNSIILNGVPQRFFGTFSWGGTPGSFSYISTSFTPAAGMTSVTVDFKLSTSRAGSYVGVSYDDFTITAVPEPAGFACLIVGLLLTRRDRRASKRTSIV